MKKLALVLSGGGFNGAFQIGALHYLKEHWPILGVDKESMDFDCVAGVSVGSLNGSLIASHQFEELCAIWEKVRKYGVEEIYTSDFIDTRSDSENVEFKVDPAFLFDTFLPEFRPDLSIWQILPLLFSKRKQRDFLQKTLRQASDEFSVNFNQFKALADNGPLEKKLKSLLKRELVKSSTFRCGFVSLNDGKYYSVKAEEFASDEDFQQGVLASSAIPIIWAPVPEVQTTHGPLKQLVDGGIKNVSPLGDVLEDIHNDPDHDYTLLIINCNTHDPIPENYENRNIAQIALRALTDISLSEIFNNDIREYLRINDILQQVGNSRELFNYDYKKQQRTQQPLRAFKTIIIQPDAGILGDSLVSTKSLFDKRHAHGIDKAKKALSLIKNRGANYNTILT
ncbi:patatin-like phospholipase family protein [Cyclobacterium jeungdonense]|uniref:Patatin-like phospholipase family protein n=1 Tax=Cyclobacterium jeungdonense TaxID=708087 RepID=A0ABT8C0H8_9BACT|nr:patatin-like phospholipase family protein [Cyclobacterium jeungdonense]MDN3686299.1 patatin-like phospholipase family protein [Cyclobacterium jeungdonense]